MNTHNINPNGNIKDLTVPEIQLKLNFYVKRFKSKLLEKYI